MVSANRLQSYIKFICLSWFVLIAISALFVFQLFVNKVYRTERGRFKAHRVAKGGNYSYHYEDTFLTVSNLSEETSEDILRGLLTDSDEDIVNPHPFEYTIVEKDICNVKRPDIFILSVIHTHPSNYKKRMHIRETWGNQRYYSKVKNVVMFTMGITDDDKVEKAVQKESERYHDIIQENFLDTYKNLSYKGIMWMRWVSTYCPNALFVLKADDDMIVNIFNVASHLRNKSILCMVWDGMPVQRHVNSKWFVSREEYPNDTFPAYCSGGAFVITYDLIYLLYKKSFTTKILWVDDVYLTGILPMGLEFTHVDLWSLYVLRYKDIEEKLAMGYALFGHNPTSSIAFRSQIWKKLLKVRNLN